MLLTKIDMFDDKDYVHFIKNIILNKTKIAKHIAYLINTQNGNMIAWEYIYKYIFGDIIVTLISVVKKLHMYEEIVKLPVKVYVDIFDQYIEMLINIHKSLYESTSLTPPGYEPHIASLVSLFFSAINQNIPILRTKYMALMIYEKYPMHADIWGMFSKSIKTGKENPLDIISPMFMAFYELTNKKSE
jgi:hypothetical protein